MAALRERCMRRVVMPAIPELVPGRPHATASSRSNHGMCWHARDTFYRRGPGVAHAHSAEGCSGAGGVRGGSSCAGSINAERAGGTEHGGRPGTSVDGGSRLASAGQWLAAAGSVRAA